MNRRLFLAGAAALAAPAPAFATHNKPKPPADGWPRPPMPLAALRILHVDPKKQMNSISGGANEDLLIVMPPTVAIGAFQVVVTGFRGIYCIGGDVLIQPWGTLRSPNGRKVAGIGAFFKLQNHAQAASPFVAVERFRYRPAPRISRWPTESIFGDFLQCGSKTPIDVYRDRIIAGPFYGWGGYYGTKGDGYNTFSKNVAHADFIKAEMGAVRRLYTSNIEVDWGYQCEFATRPSYATNYVMPPGATARFRRYSARMVRRADLGTDSAPKGFWLADSADLVRRGAFSDCSFEDCYVRPCAPFGESFMVKRGAPYGPVLSADGRHVTWPQKAPDGRALGRGLVWDASRVAAPVMVTEAEIGPRWRIASRAALVDYLKVQG